MNMKIINLEILKEKIGTFSLDNFTHVIKREESLKDDGGVLNDKNNDALWNTMDDYSFYYTNGKIGIIFDVPYACGGYSIYESKVGENYE